ncbi:MAG: hypothetical protein HKP19_14880 [Xanthomonadales bacterium]|nr:hypothetical protein [Xanthomonadales bacterium]
MNSTNRISARALLAIASLAASPAAWSLGLGNATVDSYLNQPLEARIDLITQETDDLSSVSAKLASAADYEMIGASLEDLAVPVRFSVENIEGNAYIRASSQVPVNNPVVRLIVEVNWASGRMLREYTLFLDPPTAADQAAPLPRIEQRTPPPAPEPSVEQAPPPPAPVSTPAAEPRPAPAPGEALESATEEPSVEPVRPEESVEAPRVDEPSQPPPLSTPVAGEYGPVASGETLWRIATDWSRDRDISVNQAMIAIQRENPQAFLNNNINLLKRGAILRMPAVEEVERISTSMAYDEVVAQEEAFRQGRSYIASTDTPLLSQDRAEPLDDYTIPDLAPGEDASEPAASEPAATEEESLDAQQADVADEGLAATEETDEAAAEVEAEPAVADQLELVPPSEASELDSTYGFEENPSDGDAAVASQALRENLARAEEDLINQQQQNEYLQERIRELEAQLEEAGENSVADPELAAMEQRLREQRQASQSDGATAPWYARVGVWLLGLLILAAAAAGWLLSRRSSADAEEEALQGIKDEAEEVLRVLEEDETADAPAADEEDTPSEEDKAEKSAEGDREEDPDEVDDEPEAESSEPRPSGADDEANFLDTESSDPEIQLDLARAYISMGDKEAARVILEEVAANGSEAQQAEAQKMLDLL